METHRQRGGGASWGGAPEKCKLRARRAGLLCEAGRVFLVSRDAVVSLWALVAFRVGISLSRTRPCFVPFCFFFLLSCYCFSTCPTRGHPRLAAVEQREEILEPAFYLFFILFFSYLTRALLRSFISQLWNTFKNFFFFSLSFPSRCIRSKRVFLFENCAISQIVSSRFVSIQRII